MIRKSPPLRLPEEVIQGFGLKGGGFPLVGASLFWLQLGGLAFHSLPSALTVLES